ncbi:MAG: hypothetical protein H6719_29940 [Sandaracinaceae bacterium]|nr:hypothetical protein [Sandaracinaceae bacterium]
MHAPHAPPGQGAARAWQPRGPVLRFVRRRWDLPWLWAFFTFFFGVGTTWRLLKRMGLSFFDLFIVASGHELMPYDQPTRGVLEAAMDPMFLGALALTGLFAALTVWGVAKIFLKPAGELQIDMQGRQLFAKSDGYIEGAGATSELILGFDQIAGFASGRQQIDTIMKQGGATVGKRTDFVFKLIALPHNIVVFHHGFPGPVEKVIAALAGVGYVTTPITAPPNHGR